MSLPLFVSSIALTLWFVLFRAQGIIEWGTVWLLSPLWIFVIGYIIFWASFWVIFCTKFISSFEGEEN